MAHVGEKDNSLVNSGVWWDGFPATALLFFSVFIGLMWWTRRHKYLPPGPFFPLRLLSNTNNRKRYLIFIKYGQEYGPIYSLRFGNSLTVVLNNISLAKEALVEKAEVFSERFVTKAVQIGSRGLKGSILMGNGDDYKELRRFGAYALRSFGVGKRSLGSKINEETSHLVEAIHKEENKPFDPVHVISNAVSNIICSISFGDRFDYDNVKFQQLLEVLRTLTTDAPLLNFPVLICPYLMYFPPFSKQIHRNEVVKNFINDVVEKHHATLDANDVRDIIDMFLIEADQRKGETGPDNVYDSSSLWRTIFDLFGAGSDTTANSILWAIAIFCHYPDTQEKVYEEIKAVLGTEKLPVYEDRHRLPYTQALLLEVQRFRPVAPIVPHLCNRDATLGGYHIPKGTRVLINLWSIHHDPEEWKDPELFLPERFLDSDQKVISPDSLVPFSLGRRVCLGETLAKMELFLFLTSLVQRFRFYVPDGMELPSLDGVSGITLSPEPYEVCAEPRN
ncbi:Cytochrome P450 2U1 [Holothuria leucospilota]|uniref:Steroid 21-hydroxylase n=1 Tax=Holothuria leucospilota TaxID=206669 RepID=A0A9Q1CMW1_HOLLE|nr:Cytochrome P450 2U1 [Holothuria leucospilota]